MYTIRIWLLPGLSDADMVAIDGEQWRILQEEFFESRLWAAGYLTHFTAEAFGTKLTTQVMETPRAAPI